MGLDSYLYGYIRTHFNEELQNILKDTALGEVVHCVRELKCEVGYWRKANAIHEYFVELAGEDECKEHEVSMADLDELLSRCVRIEQNRELARELLPAQDGFFFGSTEYDEGYFEDIANTIDFIMKIKQHAYKFYKITYRASW